MEGKSILITGCSSGIGLCAARILKERGYRVFASARKSKDVQMLLNQGYEGIQLDVNDHNSMLRALDQILILTNGRLDALFNNSGFSQVGAVEDLNREWDRAQFETNVFGPMELIRLILPIMREQGHGRIIQNSSILGIVAYPFCGAYNASKFALEGYSNTLRLELRGTNIFISILNPGPVITKLRDNAYAQFQATLSKSSKQSVHANSYAQLEEGYFKRTADKIAIQPEAVIEQLIRALESPKPKAHYYVGRAASWLALFRRILPDKTLDWILVKAMEYSEKSKNRFK